MAIQIDADDLIHELALAEKRVLYRSLWMMLATIAVFWILAYVWMETELPKGVSHPVIALVLVGLGSLLADTIYSTRNERARERTIRRLDQSPFDHA